MEENTNSEIEFNSMVKILKRLDQTTYEINDARSRRDYLVMVDKLIDYYKEISPDLNTEEQKVWGELQTLRRLVTPLIEERVNFVANKCDEIDIKLRGYAKSHGYLTKNIKDVRKSMIEM